jgi:hypothetical protein
MSYTVCVVLRRCVSDHLVTPHLIHLFLFSSSIASLIDLCLAKGTKWSLRLKCLSSKAFVLSIFACLYEPVEQAGA